MSSDAGGVGLGLVAGWLAAAAPLPAGPGRLGAVVAALGALAAEVALLGDGAAAAWCVTAMVAGAGLRLGLVVVARRRVAA